MATDLKKYLAREIKWRRNPDSEYPYIAIVEGRAFTIRLNDFPDEAHFTLLIENREVGDFDDWPAHWTRPPSLFPPKKKATPSPKVAQAAKPRKREATKSRAKK